MDSFVVLTLVVLWVCVIALALVVFALVRQVGVLSERVAPAGALTINKSIQVGDAAATLVVNDVQSSNPIRIGGVNEQGKSMLLFWVAPDCPVCKSLLPAFKSASKAEADWLDTVLATDGERDDVLKYIGAEGLDDYRFANSRELGTSFGVSKLPYAVLIGADGKIAASGLVNSREHFDSLFNAKDENVASLQDYLERSHRGE